MARSRTGGSSALLSGKVGDVIYSITRNTDGSFRQQISANPVERENPNTDAQARARMTMATIERAMFTLRDFMGTGFEGVDRGTNSVSKFSEVNYNAIKEQIEFWWDDPEGWDEYYNLPKKGQGQPRAGAYVLSQGSMKVQDALVVNGRGINDPYFVVSTSNRNGGVSLKTWLAQNSMRIGDQRVKAIFMEGVTPSYTAVVYIIIATNTNANPDVILTSSNFRKHLILNSNVPLNVIFDNSTGVLSFAFERGADYHFKCFSMYAERFRRPKGNVFLYNNSEFIPHAWYTPSDYGWQNLSNVKSSWLI